MPPDRSSELSEEYKNTQNMAIKPAAAEVWQGVEGQWFLFEQGDRRRVHLVIDREGHLEGCGPFATVEKMGQWGWTVTPVVVLRRS